MVEMPLHQAMMQSSEGHPLPNNRPTPPFAVIRPAPSAARSHTTNPKPFTRLAIVTGILLPIVIVPYLLTRRRISGLWRRIDELESKLSVVEKQLSFGVRETSNIKNEQARMRVTLHDMMQETDEMQQEGMQRAAMQSQTNQVIQSDLHRLLEQARDMRTQATTLQALGLSLADVAAFMHEIELQMGLQGYGSDKDKRGINRLRLLALQMQRDRERRTEQSEIHQP